MALFQLFSMNQKNLNKISNLLFARAPATFGQKPSLRILILPLVVSASELRNYLFDIKER